MGAQSINRREAHRALRQLGVDRTVGIKRISHSVDHTGPQHGRRRKRCDPEGRTGDRLLVLAGAPEDHEHVSQARMSRPARLGPRPPARAPSSWTQIEDCVVVSAAMARRRMPEAPHPRPRQRSRGRGRARPLASVATGRRAWRSDRSPGLERPDRCQTAKVGALRYACPVRMGAWAPSSRSATTPEPSWSATFATRGRRPTG